MTRRRASWIYLFAAVAAVGLFLLAAYSVGFFGFPLDDAWIHQTYARNFVQNGEWAFVPGQPSAGSTSPLWSAIMAIGQFAGIAPVFWSALIGVLTLFALARMGHDVVSTVVPNKPGWAFWSGIVLIFEWHLVWAAGSGMETLLFAVIMGKVLVDLMAKSPQMGKLGLWIGVAVWLRPEAITLLLPVGMVLFVSMDNPRNKAIGILRLAGGMAVFILPYLLMNIRLAGELLPTTFFAKQAEYAASRQLPFFGRLLSQVTIPLTGVGAMLLPWVLVEAVSSWRIKKWGYLSGLIWVVLMAGLYAVRLPVTYQHGRYLIPVIPVWLILGLIGAAKHVRPISPRFWLRVFSRTGMILIAGISIIFFALGIRAFARDVAVIESEMVITARWIAAHTEQDAIIAAHDIGALGYFGERQIVDLAGLVSPEAVPIIRDEQALRDLITLKGTSYFMTLRGWYPILETGLSIVYETNGIISPALGGENMVVYKWGPP